MRNSKFLLTSLLAAATMSATAFADTRTTQNVTTWNIKYVNGEKTYTEGQSVFKWVGSERGDAGTSTNWVSGTYSRTNGLSFTETYANPTRVNDVGFLLYFDGQNQTVTVNGTSSGQPDSSDGGGVWVTGTGNVVTVSMGRWAGSIQVDAGNVLNTSWSQQFKDGQIVAYGTVNISGANLNFDIGPNGVMSDSRQWFVGSEGVINFTTNQTTAISNAGIVLSGEVDISAAEITGLVNRSMSILLREKQLVTFSAGLSSGLDRLSLGTISSIDGASATESTALTSVDSKEALTASTYYAEKTASGVKIYYLGNGYAQETLTWAGTSADHVWVNKGSNWTKDGTATSFLDNDNVVFGTDAESKTVSVESAVSVSSAAVNDDYGFAFSNGGSVSADSVTVAATKTLTLSGTGAFASKSWSGALSIASGAAISVGTSDFVSGTASVSFADASGKISVTGTDNSSSGFTDLTGVSGAGTIEFSAAGHTVPGTGDDNTSAYNASFSWVKLSNQFTGTLSITSGVVDMLSQQGINGSGWNLPEASSSAIDMTRLGRATLIELNGGGIQFRNANNTDSEASGYVDVTFDKAISVGAAGGAIRLYGNGNVTLKSNISGAGTLSHTDGGTLTLAGTVNLTGGFTNAAGTTNFNGTTTLGTLSVSGGTLNATSLLVSAGEATANGTIAAGSVTISGGTTTITNGTIVSNGGVLEITYNSNSNWGASALRGALTINDGGTVKLTVGDATGWNSTQANRVDALTINEGGELVITTNSYNGVNQTFNMSGGITLQGGKISGTAENAYSKFDLYGSTPGITTLASSATAEISASVGLRDNGTFNVADGDAEVDLLVSGRLTSRAKFGATADTDTDNIWSTALTKSGAGTMKLTGDNQYWTSGGSVTEGTLIAASTTALGKGGTISVSENATLGFVAGTTVDMLKTTTTTNGAIQLARGAEIVVDMLRQDANQEKIVLDLVSGVALSYNGQAVTADNVDKLLGSAISLKNWGEGWTQELSYIDSSSTLRLTLTIPEPSTFGLLAGLGALALAGTRRRRKKA